MNVKRVQCLLYACGFDPGPIDGILGAKTQSALSKLHDEYGVDENGLIDVLSGKIHRLTVTMIFGKMFVISKKANLLVRVVNVVVFLLKSIKS